MLSARSSSPAIAAAYAGALALAGSALLAVSAQIAVPMWPVPITMQTLAIPVLVALLGRNVGTLAVVAYLAEIALGLPVAQGFAGGLPKLIGPTFGYLIGFPLAAWLVGDLYRTPLARTYATRFVAVLAGTAVVFVTGPLWLAATITHDLGRAVMTGVVPFVLGDVAKCLVAAGLKPRSR